MNPHPQHVSLMALTGVPLDNISLALRNLASQSTELAHFWKALNRNAMLPEVKSHGDLWSLLSTEGKGD